MLSFLSCLCGGGGTGRRKGLKIPCPSRDVPVRFRPSAPLSLPVKQRTSHECRTMPTVVGKIPQKRPYYHPPFV